MCFLGGDLGAIEPFIVDLVEDTSITDHLANSLEWIDKAVEHRFLLDIRNMDSFSFFGISNPHNHAPQVLQVV